ncbi:hypothetical protein SARC_00873 [Sphaeroforma arctica JP610]|uniref:Endonuclease/exonuclease/phosphatase domain-containing protein n=1 Tax=Sphaeroforma arctica JP610 TaxID=667725 RepID=A0A0L0GD95_9EUKA|nr:hypothetical protein SARC_00873 [Sphaeroforma arctica JP610]KNC86980.1 hypothetical protein SARC_00873 [Sphaeroforma arctica JP610]|eukprot:XP_014160882.1 hypothetical protein SARC_00873 [Sphaeroforma arctica JP610]
MPRITFTVLVTSYLAAAVVGMAVVNESVSITTFNTGLSATVANYDSRRLLLADALKKEVHTDLFCMNEMWYKQDLDLLFDDEEWMARYPYHYHYNNTEWEVAAKGEPVDSLCPATTTITLVKLMGIEECKADFTKAITVEGKLYNDLVSDLFALLDCWKTNTPDDFLIIFNNKKCYGCLVMAGTTGDIPSMLNCMRGSTDEKVNDQAFESLLYGLVLWSKIPLTNVGGKSMDWGIVPRAFISGETEFQGVQTGVLCTHVAVEGPEQQDQFREITEFVKGEEAKGIIDWIMAGDLNSGPDAADGSSTLNPDPISTNGTSSTELLTELGWWGIYDNTVPNKPTWERPVIGPDYMDGNTNICGHDTGKNCSGYTETWSAKNVLDHVMVWGDRLPRDSSRYNAIRILDTKYPSNGSIEGYHISDHYGAQVKLQ